jgi:membrane protease YdiL (CAAX protease family)
MPRTRGELRIWMSALPALLVVPWVFFWIALIVAALALPVVWATLALLAVATAFLWWNVVRPLHSRPRTVSSHRLRPWRQYAGWLTLAALAEVILTIATLVLHDQLAEWRFLPKLPNSPDLIPTHFSSHVLGPIAMIIAVAIITPMAEEFAFRGRMQSRLERSIGIIPAIVIPGVVFSLLHGPTVAPHHLPFALFVGWAVWRTGSIWTAVYVHALNNCVAVGLAYAARDWEFLSKDAPVWLWPYTIPAGLIAVSLLLVCGQRIDRIAQISRPHTRAWPRRRLSVKHGTLVLPE